MFRIGTLIALLMAFVLVNGVSFQAGATTPDAVIESSQAGTSQDDTTPLIHLAATKLDPNATYKGSGVGCRNYCKEGRQFSCRVYHRHGRRHCHCASAGPCRS